MAHKKYNGKPRNGNKRNTPYVYNLEHEIDHTAVCISREFWKAMLIAIWIPLKLMHIAIVFICYGLEEVRMYILSL